jgi:hypothetical protein
VSKPPRQLSVVAFVRVALVAPGWRVRSALGVAGWYVAAALVMEQRRLRRGQDPGARGRSSGRGGEQWTHLASESRSLERTGRRPGARPELRAVLGGALLTILPREVRALTDNRAHTRIDTEGETRGRVRARAEGRTRFGLDDACPGDRRRDGAATLADWAQDRLARLPTTE